MLEIAVDRGELSLRSYYHVWPNPLQSHGAFLAGDTGGAIIGRHIDTYDWKGHADQDTWGVRYGVTVTKAATPGAGNTIGQVQAPASTLTAIQGQCAQLVSSGALNLPPGVYANPFHASTSLIPLRIDMGVTLWHRADRRDWERDCHLRPSVRDGWGPFSCSGGHGGAVVYRLTDGPDAGRYVYIAEGIIPAVTAGQSVKAGQTIATFTGCIEIGWGSGTGDGTQAVVLGQERGAGQDPGCHSTACGENMSQLIAATGGKPASPKARSTARAVDGTAPGSPYRDRAHALRLRAQRPLRAAAGAEHFLDRAVVYDHVDGAEGLPQRPRAPPRPPATLASTRRARPRPTACALGASVAAPTAQGALGISPPVHQLDRQP